MKVQVEDAGPCRKVMRVEVDAGSVAEDYGKILESFAGAARVPGFRPGKAPGNLVERRYAKAIAEETKERLLPRLYREGVQESGLRPVGVIGVSDVSFGKDEGLSFRVTLDVAPEFKLPRYRRIALRQQTVRIGDEDVSSALQRLLERMARFEDVADRPVKRGDLVNVDYRGELDGQPLRGAVSECAELGEGQGLWIPVDEPEFVPGFNTGVEGAGIGESRSFEAVFPADYRISAVAGKTAVYCVTVHAIRERRSRALDAEALKELGVETEDALRERLRRELEERARAEERARLKEEIGKYLVEKTKLDLPQSVVEEERSTTIREMVRQFAMQGATREQIAARREDIVNAATQSSGERVKLSYILARIAEEEGIEVSEGEVTGRIEALARHYGLSPARFRAEMEKRSGLERLRSDIRADKTMDFLLENAKIKA